MYISGQIGADPDTGVIVPGGIVPETRQAFTKLGKVLEAGRMNFKNVVRCAVLLTDIKELEDTRKVYSEFFAEEPPALTVFQAVKLP
ncbi:unnamed protein product, partial [Ixodes hexagonus]